MRSISAFPTPDTPTASPNTTITFRGPGSDAAGAIVVTGSKSGAHPGQVQSHPDDQGSTFVPIARFTPGEKVADGSYQLFDTAGDPSELHDLMGTAPPRVVRPLTRALRSLEGCRASGCRHAEDIARQ